MAELAVPDGSWTFSGEVLHIVPGSGRDVHDLRKTLGEVQFAAAKQAMIRRLQES